MPSHTASTAWTARGQHTSFPFNSSYYTCRYCGNNAFEGIMGLSGCVHRTVP
jgi:hypothetical protein